LNFELNFHPAVQRWFDRTFPAPSAPQREGWPHIAAGRDTLIAAPTGTGKTLAAFLACLNDLFVKGFDGLLQDRTYVLYISPLKALSNDIEKNLREPLAGIAQTAAEMGILAPHIRVAVRTGDTLAADRLKMTKTPPHILVTTPESLFILLTAEKSRERLRGVKTVIIDEIHAVARDKRGSHLALSLERLDALCKTPPQRIGLSATQRPVELVAQFLVGAKRQLGAAALLPPNDSPHELDSTPIQGRQECRPSTVSGAEADASPPSSLLPPPSPCAIVDLGHLRKIELSVEIPPMPLSHVCSMETWAATYDRLTQLINENRTTLIFVNTRSLCERLAHHLEARIGADKVGAHHGSLSRAQRLRSEERLKAGELRALVATSSLELGIDIGSIDLVCQIGITQSIGAILQRAGRAGHSLASVSRAKLFPLTLDELATAAALASAVRRGSMDQLKIPENARDILAQHIVAASAAEEWNEDALFELVRGAYPYRNLERKEFDDVVKMLEDGFTTRRGRRSALIHHDAIGHRILGRRGARLAAITSGGAIPDAADYAVVQEPEGTKVGTLDEHFAVESSPGDIFQLGNTTWRIVKVDIGSVRVEDAKGAPPTLPFWFGEAPARSDELTKELTRHREEIEKLLETKGVDRAIDWLMQDCRSGGTPAAESAGFDPNGGKSAAAPICTAGILPASSQAGKMPAVQPHSPRERADERTRSRGEGQSSAQSEAPNSPLPPPPSPLPHAAAEQLVVYLSETKKSLGTLPTLDTLILERFFDESGGMQLILHAPFGRRVNWAWGLALRKRFCRGFNFELQAAASENSILLSLGNQHSFPLADVFNYLRENTVEPLLTQAALEAPVFQTRWRWDACRSLALLRFSGGKKVPPHLMRMRSDDLMAAIFPHAAACPENLEGDREIPDHPLVREVIHDCLHEAMDIDKLKATLANIAGGKLKLIAKDTVEPSAMAGEILAAKVYSFLDDADINERRARAVFTRRSLSRDDAQTIGALDAAAIARVRDECRPDPRDPDELHDALMTSAYLIAAEIEPFAKHLSTLLNAGRACAVSPSPLGGEGLGVRGRITQDARSEAAVSPLSPWGRGAGGEGSHSPQTLANQETDVAVYPGGVTEGSRGLRAYSPDTPGKSPLGSPHPGGVPDGGTENAHAPFYIASERAPWFEAVFKEAGRRDAGGTGAAFTLPPQIPEKDRAKSWTREDALSEIVRARMEILGPITAAQLAQEIAVDTAAIDQALITLETQGVVLRGNFSPGVTELEWCDRRLLARIHRYTLTRLRREIEPVTAADYLRFLFSWQHVDPAAQLEGPRGVTEAIAQLQGFEIAAAAWERDVLHSRVRGYDKRWLDQLSLSGEISWGRRFPAAPSPEGARHSGQIRNAPIGLFLRDQLDFWLALAPELPADESYLSSAARAVLEQLRKRGAVFFQNLTRETRRLPVEIENALGELVAFGLVTGDGFGGLRALLTSAAQRRKMRRRQRFLRERHPHLSLVPKNRLGDGLETAGRWSLFRGDGQPSLFAGVTSEEATETVARQLLRRWGVVFHRMLAREKGLPPWLDLLKVYRRLEARGEIRGGRFVAGGAGAVGFSGEQYALPEAVEHLRAARDRARTGELTSISAADPLNLVGILTPGEKIAARASTRILFRDGLPVALKEAGLVTILQQDATSELKSEIQAALAKRA